MQRPAIAFPSHLEIRAAHFFHAITALNGQSAITRRLYLRIAAKITVSERDLLEGGNVARVEFNFALETAHSLFVFTLAALDGCYQFIYSGIIGQALTGDFQFSERAVIIQVSSVKI